MKINAAARLRSSSRQYFENLSYPSGPIAPPLEKCPCCGDSNVAYLQMADYESSWAKCHNPECPAHLVGSHFTTTGQFSTSEGHEGGEEDPMYSWDLRDPECLRDAKEWALRYLRKYPNGNPYQPKPRTEVSAMSAPVQRAVDVAMKHHYATYVRNNVLYVEFPTVKAREGKVTPQLITKDGVRWKPEVELSDGVPAWDADQELPVEELPKELEVMKRLMDLPQPVVQLMREYALSLTRS